MLPATTNQIQTVVYFLKSVEDACHARDRWQQLMQRDPSNHMLQYGSQEFWDAMEQVKNYVHHIQSTFRWLPKQISHALNNMANAWLHYDAQSQNNPIPVPQAMLNDLAVLEEQIKSLPNRFSEPYLIESPKQLARMGVDVVGIAHAWECKRPNGELDIVTTEQEIENPGSIEHFKMHPEQRRRQARRKEWLALWEPVQREFDAIRGISSHKPVETVQSLWEQGVMATDAAAVLGIDEATVELAYRGLEALHVGVEPQDTVGMESDQPKSKPRAKTATRKPTKKATGKSEWDKYDDDMLAEMAVDRGLSVSEPFSRATTIAQLESLT